MPRPGEVRDISGQRFGRLVVLRFARRTEYRRSAWLCRCDCGDQAEIDGGNLKSGNSASCGCLRREVTVATWTTHGHAAGNGSPEYESWCAMTSRVNAKSGRKFRDYGARGIIICERWRTFENFLADMGSRPPGTSLDRIDNNGNYELGNCRWATPSQQNANKRRRAQTSKEETPCQSQPQQ